MARQPVTVVLPTDPESGDVDPAQPALFYSEEGFFIGSRVLSAAELSLLGGSRSGRLLLAPPGGAAPAQTAGWWTRTAI